METLARGEIRKQADGKFTVLFMNVAAGEEDQSAQLVDVVGVGAALDALKPLIAGVPGTKKRVVVSLMGIAP